MRRKSFLALFAPPVLIALSATCIFAQTTLTVVPDSKTSAAPTPDTASSASPTSDSTAPDSSTPAAAAPTPIPADADPTAPGLTPEQRRAAIQAHAAHIKAVVAAAQAQAAAARQKLAADAEHRNDPNSPQAVEARQQAQERVAANKAIAAAAKAELEANQERIKQIYANDPTTFAPDHENLNKASYQAMFKMDAFTALNEALAIQGRTTRPNLTPSESALFQAIHSGQGGKYSFAEAALIASGVDDLNKRKEYMAKIDQIVAEAKERTDKEKAIVEKAGVILDYLFAFPMKNGYDDDTYSLAQVLDTGHFNCISSVVMFVVVAHGVGLDVGAVVEPEHIVARVPGYDVQTTSGRIFATNFRLKDIQDQKYNSEADEQVRPRSSLSRSGRSTASSWSSIKTSPTRPATTSNPIRRPSAR